MTSKNTSKNVFFPVLTFDLRNDLPGETATTGPETLLPLKLVVVGVVESGGLTDREAGVCRAAWRAKTVPAQIDLETGNSAPPT